MNGPDPIAPQTSRAPDTLEVSGETTGRLRERNAIASTTMVVLFVMLVIWLRIDRIVTNTTPTGGDNGGHVWTADFVRREMLPQLRLTGWSNDWFGGVPVLGFYFPAPTWLIVVLSFVIPYAIAYKLVSVLGIVTLPLVARWLGRKADLDTTRTFFLVLSVYSFLLLRHYRILGGNILSTMAGEFSFSISLSLALLYSGLLLRVLRTGTGRAITALVLALTGLSHIVPTILALLYTAAALLVELRKDHWRRQVQDVIAVGATGGGIAGFWLLPFAFNLHLTNSMDYERYTKFVKLLFPFFPESAGMQTPPDGIVFACAALALSAVAAVVAWRRKDRFLQAWVLTWVFSGLAVRIAPQGPMWNIRLLPLWYFCAYLLAGQALALLALTWRARAGATESPEATAGDIALADADPSAAQAASEPAVAVQRKRPIAPRGPALLGLLVAAFTVFPAFSLIPGSLPAPVRTKQGIELGSLQDLKDFKNAPMPFGWSASNAEGAQAKSGWDEYKRLVDTLQTLPCGRALWEPNKDMVRYGTPMALMALPYWTKSCIQSFEGLFFESSATTPFHWLTRAYVADKPSNPQRRLPYPSFDMAKGVDRMRALGIRYYLAVTTKAKQAAAVNPDLRRVAASDPFVIYEIKGHEIVSSLTTEPVVATGVRSGLDGGFIDTGIAQWMNPLQYPTTLALNGPRTWARQRFNVDEPVLTGSTWTKRGSKVTAGPAPAARPLPPVAISNVDIETDSLSFDVDRVGVPVLVRVSYFPNWKVDGGQGPYRVAPNFMVVVPTDKHVEMRYGRSSSEVAGHAASLAGLVGLVGLFAADRRRRPRAA